MKKKSKSFSLRRTTSFVSSFLDTMYEDRVTVYAAQASFFFVISSIPFIMLLLSLSSFIIPDAAYHMMASFGATLPQNIGRFYMDILSELYERPPINLISITAITAFWMASRALSSLRVGISNIYRSHPENTFLRDIAMSIIYTVAFLVMMILTIVLILFGRVLHNAANAALPNLRGVIDSVIAFRAPMIFVFMTIFFWILYYAANRRGDYIGKKFVYHLPGAVLAAAGWILFSYIYSLYAIYFDGASYLYGSLTALILLMFWMYFCMIILLVGAEVNKTLAQRRKRKKELEGNAERLKADAETETETESNGD
ncbi:MAG: YihY/virulence factor BrkB family protein [Clostridia bacterium]|nr:YihY/virulence factor BrkB family protein [Clostridia bacterium]